MSYLDLYVDTTETLQQILDFRESALKANMRQSERLDAYSGDGVSECLDEIKKVTHVRMWYPVVENKKWDGESWGMFEMPVPCDFPFSDYSFGHPFVKKPSRDR